MTRAHPDLALCVRQSARFRVVRECAKERVRERSEVSRRLDYVLVVLDSTLSSFLVVSLFLVQLISTPLFIIFK